jgi:TPR repeat protein
MPRCTTRRAGQRAATKDDRLDCHYKTDFHEPTRCRAKAWEREMSESNIQASPGSIFICYRREDSADVTGRIYDRLVDHFGSERVFMDVEAIRLGYDFRSEIDQTIKVCSIVIVVIGDKWLAEVNSKRRIDDENDRVRIEIEAALRREIPIIPVLTRGASHPTKAMLPASLEALAYRHGTSIRHEHFRGDVDSLISQMDKLLAHEESTSSKLAEPKEPILPVKSTQMLQSQPAVPLVASLSSVAASKESAVWKGRRIITVTASGAIGMLLLATIAVLLMRPHPSVRPSQEDDYTEGIKLAWGLSGMRMDQAKAEEYFQRAAAKNIPEAEARLAVRINNGVGGLAKDNVKAEQWAKKALADDLTARATNSVDAQIELAALYEFGLGVSKDETKASELIRKAADQGNARAQTNLGGFYQKGLGVPKDLGKAAELYQKAVDQGLAVAENNLGKLYQNGLGVTKDSAKAAELYQKAADQGDAAAQNNLGYLYENGDGVPTDFAKAEQLYQKAADQGNQAAIANLKRLSGH